MRHRVGFLNVTFTLVDCNHQEKFCFFTFAINWRSTCRNCSQLCHYVNYVPLTPPTLNTPMRCIRRFSCHCFFLFPFFFFLQSLQFIALCIIYELGINLQVPIIDDMAYKGLPTYGEPVGPDELADVQEELRRLQTENVRFK